MNGSMVIQSQLLATKFFVPSVSHDLLDRPRLRTLLQKSLQYPLTIISAPAGFGKTTLLSSWIQSLPTHHPRIAWLSLDEEDNDPQLFWTYVLSALSTHQSEGLISLFKSLQSPQAPSLKYLLKGLINILAESRQQFVLILDDYHLITEQQVHTTLSYLVEYLPAQMHIILSTRTDPPLPLSKLRARQQLLEIHTDQLRCTTEETKAFFKIVMGIQLPEETIEEVTAHTEGWLVGLQLIGLSLRESTHPASLLEEISGDQRYILDYLTEEVLRKQPEEIQTFLLSTCILEQLNASLCDTVTEQSNSQQMLEQLEQANLFVVSLDSRRQWYRYHALFAEALHYRLEQSHSDLVPGLHHRASLWYSEHDQDTQAILHALHAKEWHRAADLIERKSRALNALTWGVRHHQLFLLRDWLEQIPANVIHSRPSLFLAHIWMLMMITPQSTLETWVNTVETILTNTLTKKPTEREASPSLSIPEEQDERENMLGETLSYRAILQSLGKDGETALALCQQAQALLKADNIGAHAHLGATRVFSSYASSINDAEAAIQFGLQTVAYQQAAGNPDQVVAILGLTAMHMIGTGRLHEVYRLTQQAILQGKQPGALVPPRIGWPIALQAEVLREWNDLDTALSLAEEGIKLCQQLEWTLAPLFLHYGYATLLRTLLSRRDLDTAYSVFQQFEHIDRRINPSFSLYFRSFFTIGDQIRLWLACGEVTRAIRWAQELDIRERSGTPFTHEREEVAYARVLLAQAQPDLALKQLEPMLQRATAGKRWGHVIEMRILQALAHQMHQQERQALDALSEAVRLAEPEGYIRSFVDEGLPMVTLLSQLREQYRSNGQTPYLDTVLAAFRCKTKKRQQKQERYR